MARCTLVALAAWLMTACASTLAPHNLAVSPDHPASSYRMSLHPLQEIPPDLSISLSFSGGGTRAAALAYGVLREMANTPITVNGQPRRIIDMVSSISAVSGGSVTALYYGLYGDRLFDDFENRFLKRDIESEITDEIFALKNLFRMTSPWFGRSDVVAEYLDETLFEGRTFNDLQTAIEANRRPFILVNATDMALTSRFEFTQDQFDFLCSDLGAYPLSRALAASSAVPVIFSPITLANHAGECAFEPPGWMQRALQSRQTSLRRYVIAQDQRTYLADQKRRYIHLLDGGLSDNLGLRAMLDRLALADAAELATTNERLNIRRIVHIAVNAQARPVMLELDTRAEVPTLEAIAFAVSNATDRYSIETLALARASMLQVVESLVQQRTERAMPDPNDVKATLIEVSFSQIADPAEQAYFNTLATSFSLPDEAVDRLRDAGAKILRNSAGYLELIKEFDNR